LGLNFFAGKYYLILMAYNMDVWEVTLGAYRKRVWNKTFRGLSDVADVAAADRYADIVMTAGSPEKVLKKAMKRPILAWYPLSQRLGFKEPDEPPTLYIDDGETIERLKNMLAERPDREEVDCAILVDDDGRLCIEHGTRYLKGDLEKFEDIRGPGFIEAGAGRIVAGAISLERGVAGYMLKKTGILKEYRLGWPDLEYSPKTGIIAVYRRLRIPTAEGVQGRRKNAKVMLIGRRKRTVTYLNPDETPAKERDLTNREAGIFCPA